VWRSTDKLPAPTVENGVQVFWPVQKTFTISWDILAEIELSIKNEGVLLRIANFKSYDQFQDMAPSFTSGWIVRLCKNKDQTEFFFKLKNKKQEKFEYATNQSVGQKPSEEDPEAAAADGATQEPVAEVGVELGVVGLCSMSLENFFFVTESTRSVCPWKLIRTVFYLSEVPFGCCFLG